MNTISSLETTDLPAAYHIEQRAHAFPWSEKTFASNQGERYLNFQLTQNGKMAAFAITQVVLDEATLFNIAVDPDYQRQGLGRALLEHLIDELEKRGVATLWLEVRASNAAAIGCSGGKSGSAAKSGGGAGNLHRIYGFIAWRDWTTGWAGDELGGRTGDLSGGGGTGRNRVITDVAIKKTASGTRP